MTTDNGCHKKAVSKHYLVVITRKARRIIFSRKTLFMKGFLYALMMMTGETELNGVVLPHVTMSDLRKPKQTSGS